MFNEGKEWRASVALYTMNSSNHNSIHWGKFEWVFFINFFYHNFFLDIYGVGVSVCFCFCFGRSSTWDRNELCGTLSQAFCDWFVISAGHTAMTGGCSGRYTVSSMKIRHLLNLNEVNVLDLTLWLKKQSDPKFPRRFLNKVLIQHFLLASFNVSFVE